MPTTDRIARKQQSQRMFERGFRQAAAAVQPIVVPIAYNHRIESVRSSVQMQHMVVVICRSHRKFDQPVGPLAIEDVADHAAGARQALDQDTSCRIALDISEGSHRIPVIRPGRRPMTIFQFHL